MRIIDQLRVDRSSRRLGEGRNTHLAHDWQSARAQLSVAPGGGAGGGGPGDEQGGAEERRTWMAGGGTGTGAAAAAARGGGGREQAEGETPWCECDCCVSVCDGLGLLVLW